MVRIYSFLVFCLFGASSLLAVNGDSTGTFFFEVKQLPVILRQISSNETISAQLYLRGGVENLTESNQGIESFAFNSAVLKDKKYADKEWGRLLSGVGAQIGAAHHKDFTIVSLRCSGEYFDKLWEVFADYVMNTGFYDERVEVTRQRMLTEIRQRKDTPDTYIRDLAEQQFYAGSPYELSPGGVESSISKVTMKDMRDYLKDNLKKRRLLLVVVGNVERKPLEKKIRKTFAKISKGKYRTARPSAIEHSQSKLEVVERDLPTNYLLGLFSAPSRRDSNYYAMSIAIDILKARLFEEVRTKRNLSYAPDAFLADYFSNYGGIYATSDHPDSTAKIMLAELGKLKTELVDEKDLRDRINMYLTRYYLSNEANAEQGLFLARAELSGVGWRQGGQIVENLRKVTATDVQRVAQKYFRKLQFVYLGNPKLIDEAVLTSM